MSALLRVLRDGKTIATHEVSEPVTVGRAEGCVIRLEDHAISRKHAVLTPDSDGKVLKFERKSDFGWIRHNGVESSQGLARPGDVLELGPFRIEFELREPTRVESSSAGVPMAAVAAPAPIAIAQPVAVPVQEEEQSDPVSLQISDSVAARELTGESLESSGSSGLNLELGAPAAESMAGDDPMSRLDPPMEMGAVPEVESVSGDGSMGLESDSVPPLEEAPSIELAGGVGPASQAGSASDRTGVFDPDGATRLTPIGGLVGRLFFEPGVANSESFDIQETAVIGRGGAGKPVDVELKDKRCSRQHLEIRQVQGRYLLRDLGSENGTVLNGERIPSGAEVDLPSGSTILAGETQFRFDIVSQDYQAREGGFLPSVANDLSGESVALNSGAYSPADMMPEDQGFNYDPTGSAQPFGLSPDAGSVDPGVTAVEQPVTHPPGIRGLWSKFKAQPQRTRLMIIAVAAATVMLFSVEDEEEVKKAQKPKPKPSATAGIATRRFEDLSPEQQKLVMQYEEQATADYKTGQYDTALKWVKLAQEILPSHDQAMILEEMISKAQQDAKRRAEEKARAEQEKADQERKQAILAELETMMETARKRPRSPTRFDDVYQTLDQSDIKRLDPENAMIRKWELEIGEDRDKYQRLEESRKLASERSEMAAAKLKEVEPFRKAVADASDPIEKLRRLKTLHSELEDVRDALPRDSDDLDKEVSAQNRKVWKVIEIIEQDIVSCHKSLEDFMASHFEDAKGVERAAEASGNPEDYNKAFTRWSKVSEIEGELELAWLGHKSTEELKPQGKLGMSRIRGVLNDRGKALYTEAILAESYSDFAKAREKFEDLLRIAPSDDQSVDSYFARARRKLTVYSQFDKALGKERMPAADPTAGTATDSPPAPAVLNAEPVPDTSEVPAAQPVEVSPAVPSSADAGGTGP